MKLRIKGLVFTGFAAAVFASSAMAVVPPTVQYPDPANNTSHAEAIDGLKKTVTAQYYTDETFQARDDTGLATNDNGDVTEKAVKVGWKYGQGQLNTEWVKLEGAMQLSSDDQGYDTEYVEIIHGGKGVDSHNIRVNPSSITVDTGTPGQQGFSSGADKIEDAGDPNATSLEKGRLTTAKAVYDFVTGAGGGNGFQRKVDLTTDSGQIGVRVNTGTEQNPVYQDGWYDLAAGQDGNLVNSSVDHQPYARIYRDDDDTNGNVPGVYVDLDHSRIVASSAYTGNEYQDGIDLTALASSTLGEEGMALVTAGAVYDLLDRETSNTTTISASSTNNQVPTSKNVFDYVQSVVGDNTLPSTAGTACMAEGKHCALVTVYHAADAQHANPYTTLEWVVMAGN